MISSTMARQEDPGDILEKWDMGGVDWTVNIVYSRERCCTGVQMSGRNGKDVDKL